MIDLTYIKNNNSNVQMYLNGGTWQTWVKPRNAKSVTFMVMGSGAGGGGGFQAASGSIGGGGSGGNGSLTQATFLANMIPDLLYIYCGVGGAGGLGGNPSTAGSSGQLSYVTFNPDFSVASNILIKSGSAVATGGGGGTINAGTAGASETVNLVSSNIFLNMGIFVTQGFTNGALGGTVNGTSIAQTLFLASGGGGGGTGTGGGQTSPGIYPVVAVTPINTNGRNGMFMTKPFGFTGPTGGGGGTNGGKGGDGSPAVGGAGGGAGTVSAGNGGRGGDGFIMITTNF